MVPGTSQAYSFSPWGMEEELGGGRNSYVAVKLVRRGGILRAFSLLFFPILILLTWDHAPFFHTRCRPGAGLQCQAAEGFPECHHALGHASSGCLQLPLAGAGPPWEE